MSQMVLNQRASGLVLWLQAARPKTLTAAIVPVLVGAAVAFFEQPALAVSRWWVAAVALSSALAIQVGTNFFNDAIDFRKGADTPDRVGPTRITQAGLRSEAQVLRAAWISFAVAVLFGAVLVVEGGAPILLIGVTSLLFGYLYTGGPYPLAYRGLGDLFVLLFFGLIAVSGTAFLITGGWSGQALVAGAQVGFLAVVLIAINNLRDREGDQAAGKRTLAVLLGVQGARAEISAALMLPFILGVQWYEMAAWAGILPLAALPLAILIARRVWVLPPGRGYNGILASAAALHALFGLLLSSGLVLEQLWK